LRSFEAPCAPERRRGGHGIPVLPEIWVVGFGRVLTMAPDRLLFRPILRTIARRFRSAREIDKQMDDRRRVVLAARAEILAQTRAEAEAGIAEATRPLQTEAEDVRKRRTAEAESFGQVAAERILGRRAS
jgi:hypothetical protein